MSVSRLVTRRDSRRLATWRRAALVSALSLGVGCSASDGGGTPARAGNATGSPDFFVPVGGTANPGSGNANAGGSTTGGSTTEGNGLNGLVNDPVAGGGSVGIDQACIVSGETAELVKQPVDIILVLDNSGSMSDEIEGVEANINLNFASILANSDVDYRVILISRHRREPRASSGESSTSICVSAPLSGLSDCTQAPEPVFSDHFFQYSTKVESTDSFDVLLDTFAPPFESSSREEKFDHAPQGWSAWLRPGAKKVFLELTDDNEDMSVADFLDRLMALAPEQFGSDPAAPHFVFHSIVGIAEKADPTQAYSPDEPLQSETCTGNGNKVDDAGTTYQELSRLTGGLRFPLCQFGAYDVVFRRIAEDVVLTSSIACDFAIPPAPTGSALDLANVAIQYQPGSGGVPVTFGQAPSAAACQGDAFYIAGSRLNLCPDSCTRIRRDPTASVSVLFACESQLIVPR